MASTRTPPMAALVGDGKAEPTDPPLVLEGEEDEEPEGVLEVPVLVWMVKGFDGPTEELEDAVMLCKNRSRKNGVVGWESVPGRVGRCGLDGESRRAA